MAEEKSNFDNNTNNIEKPSSNVGGLDFLLFLILILLVTGNSNAFNTYFQVLDKQVKKVNQIINTFSVTAESLKAAFEAPQKMKNDLNL